MMIDKGNYKLYKGDCLEVMDKLIEEGIKVDAIITDPPYGTTSCKWDSVIPFNRYIAIKEGKRYKTLYKDEFMLRKFKEGINIKEAEKEWKENSKEGMWDKLNKLIKPNGAIVLFGNEPFSSDLRTSNIKNFRHEWYWNKINAGNFVQAKNHPLKIVENIMVFSNNKVIYNPQMIENTEEYTKQLKAKHKNKKESSMLQTVEDKYFVMASGKFKSGSDEKFAYPKNIITMSKFSNECNSRHRLHPTQKPVPLLEYLIKTYTNEGDLVLDFTMGSGSTGVACLNTNRRFIGIVLKEIDFNIAKKRIEDTDGELKNN